MGYIELLITKYEIILQWNLSIMTIWCIILLWFSWIKPGEWSELDYTYCFLNLANIDLDQVCLTLQQLGHIALKLG